MYYIGSKDKLYQGEKQSIPTCLRYLYALFYLIEECVFLYRKKILYEDVYIEIYKKRFICGAYSYSEYSTPSSDRTQYPSIGHHI